MTKILNQDAFNEAKIEYAKSIGYTRADGAEKNLSRFTEEALESELLLVYLVKDKRLKYIT